jgi:gamma-tubulin complex component 2
MTAAERATVGRQKFCRESLMLAYSVPWPVSVVAPDSAVAQYQMIFRHLFELKWVDRELSRVAALYQATRPLSNRQRVATRRDSLAPAAAAAAAATGGRGAPPAASAAALASAHRAAQLMTHFFRQYLLYVSFEVLEPLWAALEARVAGAASVDELVEHHRVFLRKVMKGLLLSRKVVVLRALLGLKDLALQFVALSGARLDPGGRGPPAAGDAPGAPDWQRRAARAEAARAELDARLADPSFAVPVG